MYRNKKTHDWDFLTRDIKALISYSSSIVCIYLYFILYIILNINKNKYYACERFAYIVRNKVHL